MDKVEEVRLMESRKSARLQQDSSDGQYPQLQYHQLSASLTAKNQPASSNKINVPDSLERNR